eukprot:TRINITY_DN17301_c0_g1_i1.p1 TRINITY_DN17301_c0_g1~~TRINITY_DN17301_c0_g1_i1.p1  ORF type:complete len:406 (-),score=12.90 TRINITY_DN17301_c0_g1_i1:8-1159(-)
MSPTILLLLIGVVCVQSQLSCVNGTSCNTCLNLNNQSLSCGWCGATQMCLEKNPDRSPASYCFGDTWEVSKCANCASMTDCRSCNAHPGDCQWCGQPNATARCAKRNTPGCPVKPNCPCEDYNNDCEGCLQDVTCNFCGDGTCKIATANDATCKDTCPCSNNADCDSCRSQPGCGWCSTSGSCVELAGNTCPLMTTSCNVYCNKTGYGSCDKCTATPGCSWCDDSATCLDSRVQSSCFLTHQCPPSCDHKYCDPCLDAGCVWCGSSKQCMSKQMALKNNSGCMAAHSCPSYCQGYSDCGSCNGVLGCAWCGSSNQCIDKDKTTDCLLTLTCDAIPIDPTCPSFSGKSFVGGMFLIIGLMVVGVAAFAFYRWYTGKKILYTELR